MVPVVWRPSCGLFGIATQHCFRVTVGIIRFLFRRWYHRSGPLDFRWDRGGLRHFHSEMVPIATVSRRRLSGLRRDRWLDFRSIGFGPESRWLLFNRLTGTP